MTRRAAPASASTQTRNRAIRTALELVIALLLAALGVWHIWNDADADAWTGFALIGLGLLLYLMRGQIITKLSFGKEGIAAELQQKVEDALERADEAQKDATIAKAAMNQYVGPPGEDEVEPARTSAGVEAGSAWDHPTLQPGKRVKNDPQKNQWGGKPINNGRQLSAEVDELDDNWFNLTLRVTATPDGAPLVNRVRFHLHHTFRRSVVTVTPKNGVAEIERIAWGAFTVGAEVESEPETFLELDLAEAPNLPLDFRKR